DAPVGEGGAAGVVLGFVAHAGPDVGGDQVGAAAGFDGVVELAQHAGGRGAHAGRVELVAARGRHVQREAQHFGGLQPGVRHIVGVADPGHRLAGYGAAVFDIGEDIGQDLARVKLVGQAVDDRHARVRGKALDAGLLEGADHDDVD